MLDAARDLLLERGSGNATVEAIADVSGAPTGSIYTGSGHPTGSSPAAPHGFPLEPRGGREGRLWRVVSEI
jgi:hypothetical protein